MVSIEIKPGEDGHEVVGECVKRYWRHNYICDVIISLEQSDNGIDWIAFNEIAFCSGSDYYDVEFLNDWWDVGMAYILRGIKSVDEIKVSGGIYED